MENTPNKSELGFTGERIVTEVFQYWTLEHLHRYTLALAFAKDKVVVDIASGEGYGSYLLTSKAQKVVGIDISAEAIIHSNKKYQANNLEYIVGSAFEIPLEDHTADLLVSFETIEHHDQHDKMLQEIKRVLKPNGILIISSPDKLNYSDIPQYKNPFHVKELYKEAFATLIKGYFSNTKFLNQKAVIGSIIVQEETIINQKLYSEYTGSYTKIIDNLKDSYIYNLCIASEIEIPIEGYGQVSCFFSEELLKRFELLESDSAVLKNIRNSRLFRLTSKLSKLLNYIR